MQTCCIPPGQGLVQIACDNTLPQDLYRPYLATGQLILPLLAEQIVYINPSASSGVANPKPETCDDLRVLQTAFHNKLPAVSNVTHWFPSGSKGHDSQSSGEPAF